MRSSVVSGGRRIAISWPRARAVRAAELVLPSFAWVAHADPPNAATMAARLSTRRYQTTLVPPPADEMRSAVSKSAVSRCFVALGAERLLRGAQHGYTLQGT